MTDTRYRSVAARRIRLGLTQELLADRAGITRQTLALIEGGRTVPTLEVAFALSEALDCTAEELFRPMRFEEAIVLFTVGGPSLSMTPIIAVDEVTQGHVPVLFAGQVNSGKTTLLSSAVRSLGQRRVALLISEREDLELLVRDCYVPANASTVKVPSPPADGNQERLKSWLDSIGELGSLLVRSDVDVVVMPELHEAADFVTASVIGGRTGLPIYATIHCTTRREVDDRLVAMHALRAKAANAPAVESMFERAILRDAELYWNSGLIVFADRKNFRIERLFDEAHPSERTLETIYAIWCERVADRVKAEVPALEFAWEGRTLDDTDDAPDRDLGHFSNQGRFVNLSLMHDGRVHISGLEAVLTPAESGRPVPRTRALFPGGLAQLVSINEDGADLASRAIVAWLTFDDAKTEQVRDAVRAHAAQALMA